MFCCICSRIMLACSCGVTIFTFPLSISVATLLKLEITPARNKLNSLALRALLRALSIVLPAISVK